jgi:hypothetical protein
MSATPIAAVTPAASRRPLPPPAIRAATLNASNSERSPPARATTIQSATGTPASSFESGATTVVNMTGSGFHEGPPVVSSEKWAISRPHTSHAHGS